MSAALPNIEIGCCPEECDDVVVQNIPGPAGTPGTNGTNGTNGISAITTLAASYEMPAEGATRQAALGSTAGLVLGENVFIQSLGTLQVASIESAILATFRNLENTATGIYADNAAAGTVAPIGSRIGPTGLQGVNGVLAGSAAGGDLKGTYPNPKLALPNVKGALAVGNGTDANSLSAGTNGQIPAYDSTQALGLIPKSIIPITGDTNVAANRVVRLSSATGTPIALGASKFSVKDPGGAGAVVADESSGNARGTDAVDLQVNRATVGVAGVASGARAVITGGQDNIASADRSVVSGGSNNANSGLEAFIGGGKDHIIDSAQSAIVGGDTNKITGGAATESFIGGGSFNKVNATAFQAVLVGGDGNTVSAERGAILGGAGNIVTGTAAVIVGGINTTADKYGQRAFSAGRFAAQADCQQSDLIWRVTTTDATITEAFLDGAGGSFRATIASGKSWAFDILVIGRSSAGVSAAWTVRGAIQNNAGTTALVAAVTTTVIADGTGATWGVAGGVTVDADNANDALRVRVTGAAATTIRWGISAKLMEVGH